MLPEYVFIPLSHFMTEISFPLAVCVSISMEKNGKSSYSILRNDIKYMIIYSATKTMLF